VGWSQRSWQQGPRISEGRRQPQGAHCLPSRAMELQNVLKLPDVTATGESISQKAPMKWNASGPLNVKDGCLLDGVRVVFTSSVDRGQNENST
jgi:hypothetical protein